MSKTYFIVLYRQKDIATEERSFFYHKPLFQTMREMIDFIYTEYPNWVVKTIKRIR